MISTSPYDIIQAAPPEWRPQEDRAASAFIGITFFLCLETLFEIFRVFKKRQGLYFWCLFVGVVGCFVFAIGITLKYLVHDSTGYWPLYTLFALSGWTCFSLCQLLILYSRLHLLTDNHRLQRWVLYLICGCAVFFTLPTWIVVWPAYNPKHTRRWSAPDAIVERINQVGFTLTECAVSGVYFHALSRLLKYKPTVRQRRVFWDLVYVNVAVILLDILTTVLIYLNQLGTSHPVQGLSYIFKFRLEFAVLNQLMAVAARGIRRDTFGERRYHDNSVQESWLSKQDYPILGLTKPPEDCQDSEGPLGQPVTPGSSRDEVDIAVPTAVFGKALDKTRSQRHLGNDPAIPIQSRQASNRDADRHGGPRSKARALVESFRPRSHRGANNPNGSVEAKARHQSVQDDEADEIQLHMWERDGDVVMRIPWLPANRRGEV